MTTTARPTPRLDPDALAALEEQRDFLLGSLDDLEREHDAGDIDEHDYQTLRDDYTVRAAEVLRAIDQRRQAFADARRPRSTGRIVAVVAAVLVFAVVAGLLVANALGGRAPDQALTGGIRQTPSQDAKRCIDQIRPGSDPRPALHCFQKVLQRDPQNAVALAYQGWTLNLTVMATSNLQPSAAKQFRTDAARFVARAVKSDPTYSDALAFAAIISFQQGRFADAQKALRAFDRSHPPAEMTSLIKQFALRPAIARGLAAQAKKTGR
ncbi:MAG: tetratricopeptide repeat protein [Actinomycetota bacterium]|nr:tetratricopeptide repeat protein [Actinomycetota bacterium]